MQRKRGFSCGPFAGVAAASLVLALIMSLFFWTKVDAGTACVVTRGGKVTEVATQGVVMDLQTFTPVQSIMVTVTPSHDTD